MALLSSSEAVDAGESFLSSLYGREVYARWKQLKREMQFTSESHFVTWLIDVAVTVRYTNNDGSSNVSDAPAFPLPEENYTMKTEYEFCSNDSGNQADELGDYDNGLNMNKRKEERFSDMECGKTPGEVIKSKRKKYSVTKRDGNNSDGDDRGEACSDGELLDSEAPLPLPSDIGDRDNVAGNGGEGESVSGTTSTLPLGFPASPDRSDFASFPPALPLVPTALVPGTTWHGAAGGAVGPVFEKKFRCPHCAYDSNRKQDMIRHVKAVHELCKSFACPFCSYRCSQKTHLKSHCRYKHKMGEVFSPLMQSPAAAFPESWAQVGTQQQEQSAPAAIQERENITIDQS